MQKAVRILRAALPLLFVGFALLVIFSYSSNRRVANRDEATPLTSTIRTGDRPQVVAELFEDTQTIGGRVVSRIRARRTVGFKSGWYTLEEVELTVFREDGTTYELSAPVAQFNAETKEASLSGGARVQSSDGMMLRTKEIRFDGKTLANRIPVEFRVNRWSGGAGGLRLDVENQTLQLVDHVGATLEAPESDEQIVHLDSDEATFHRADNRVTFSDHVVVHRAGDTVSVRNAVAQFDQSGRTLVGLDGSGGVLARLTADSSIAGRGPAAEGEKTIRADRFSTELDPDGALRTLVTYGGVSQAVAELAGPPRRAVVADTLRASFARGVVSNLTATGSVRMTEALPQGLRSLAANSVSVAFDAPKANARSAVAEGNVLLSDPRLAASANRANYEFVNGHVVLTATPGGQPVVRADGQVIKADVIDANLREGAIKLTTNVTAQLHQASKADGGGLFPSASGPIYVNSDTGMIRKEGGTAFFAGNVRAWQQKNTLLTRELLVQNGGELVQATGAVRLVLYDTGQSGDGSPILARGEKLVARKSDRTVTLTGEVRIDQSGRTLSTRTSTFLFDAGNKLQQVQTSGEVRLSEKATGRKGEAEDGRYVVRDQMLYLTGSPAVVTDAKGTVRGAQIALDLARNKVDILSGPLPSENTYNPQ